MNNFTLILRRRADLLALLNAVDVPAKNFAVSTGPMTELRS